MSFEIKGLKELQKNLDDFANRADAVDGTHSVSFDELFSDEFVSKHSRFNSMSELIDASEFKVESQDDFEAIPDEPWDQFIQENTSFGSWGEMKESAGAQWAKSKLGL